MRVIPVPVLSDNYAYLLVNESDMAAAVDPADPDKVIAAAKEHNVTITTVLTTHSHRDHDGGNEKLSQLLPGLAIYGGAKDNVQACTNTVADGEQIQLGPIEITCLETPYHTRGHICYLCGDPSTSERLVFTGDSLFVAGCGRNFTANVDQMYHSLMNVIAALPPDTKVYCGHEYTVSNLKFAATVDKENPAVKEKLAWAEQQRAAGLPTVPSTIGEELLYNPFLRCGDRSIARALRTTRPKETLAKLRELKDNFGASAVVVTTLLNAYSFGQNMLRRAGWAT